MQERKKHILFTIIKEHIETKVPVGSSVLVQKYNLDVSPATVRNIMVELEEEGFIRQPYVSAGRVPTEKAYQIYIETLKSSPNQLAKTEKKELDKSLKHLDEAGFKETAKILAEISEGAVFWAFHKNNLYYTGISNLLQQPEFRKTGTLLSVSTVIDRMDEIISDIFEDLKSESRIFIGSENPFGSFCSTVLAKYRLGNKNGMFGILGPLRMDYEKNFSLVDFALKKINK